MPEKRDAPRGARWGGLSRPRRWSVVGLAVTGLLGTLLGSLLVLGAWSNDRNIDQNLGETTAEVLSVSGFRTLVRYHASDGAVHSPATGVLYPDGLERGNLVRVEYDQENPDLVRVAGRGFGLGVVPVVGVVTGLWIVLCLLIWWLRRPMRAAAAPA
ncbi:MULTISPECIES: DUF3592 domain-containing protein [Actinoalloteichus]|uniref:DUF3592 domain-containing protein n=1 Tax=Actinoalloteichus TaxID=65496 RepID=UPI001FE0881E|nr:DUF3592 domain-containing protein [Actinoalloteichus caeruleus]